MAFTFFRTSSTTKNASELPAIFEMQLTKDKFIRGDILDTYTKILTDTAERMIGLPEKKEPLLWDSCVQDAVSEGLVTMLAVAMTDQTDLFLVYSPSANVVRRATQEEISKIRDDYKREAKSSTGVFISFARYRRTEMLRIYSELEYCVLANLNKTLNVSKALQVKVNDLRASVSLKDSETAAQQGRGIAQALGAGFDVMLDKADEITSAAPNTDPAEKAISFLDSKRAFILGFPQAYISGLQSSGIGATGEGDMRAIERGLKQFFVSIIQPAVNALFGASVEFKTQDFRQIDTALNVLRTFDLVSDENMSVEAKREIIARVFDLNQEKEKKRLDVADTEREENRPDFGAPPQTDDDSEEDE